MEIDRIEIDKKKERLVQRKITHTQTIANGNKQIIQEVIIEPLWVNHLEQEQSKESDHEENHTQQIFAQEALAQVWINEEVINKARQQENKTGEIQSESFFGLISQEAIYNFLKEQSLFFIGEAIRNLKVQAWGWLVDLANWLWNQSESVIINLYNNSTKEEKEMFLMKMEQHFSNTDLFKKLKENS